MVADLFSAKRVYVSPARFRSAPYRKILADFNRTPGLVLTLSCNDHVGPWTVLHPAPSDQFPQADDDCLVLAGTFGGTRVLLLSDLGRAGQNALLARTNELRADIVVTGIPVQTEPIGDALLDAIQPRVIIVADSEFPPTARASAKLHDRLGRRQATVIYTRQAGAATLVLRGGKWELRTMSGLRITNNDNAQGARQ
jgi:beta-lactamase superfamily II metal-dependent hydrolase